MPRTPIDYSKGIIYKLACKDPDIEDIYVGSTTNQVKRKTQHKSGCNTETNTHHNRNVYVFIRDNGGWDNWDMIEIEKISCNDGYELRSRERYWFDTLKATLNTDTPNGTQKEYYEKNKEKMRKQHKEYYDEHKEEVSLYNKEYASKNKEKLALYKKEYASKNKDKITCECGSTMLYTGRNKHKKTKKHQNFLISQENQ